ncbi:transcriptional regulator, TetR family [Spongiibacter sp. IMCC21906]|uniref:TetR family transcriptional regulator n=1 Tax=Spongiibacter sp. IMCC21906 TaxID=1620392 RepID=UPI00062DDFAF|nr:TetR family transcriptional regulator [Spongiibacter sp. IMCC21906]AKH70189.1 transcriptional regulator, TetR family [Spongiibacter sp. IMCC21906]
MRRSKEDADATRTSILNAAEWLFSTQGIASTRLIDVANRAEVTRGAIYWHFKNKEEIINAIIDRLVTPSEAAIETFFKSGETNPSVTIETLRDIVLQGLIRLRTDCSAKQGTRLILRYSLCAESKSVASKLENEREAGLNRIYRFLDIAKSQGYLRSDYSVEAMSLHVRAHITGLYHHFLSDPEKYPSDNHLKESLDMLFSGLSVPSVPS